MATEISSNKIVKYNVTKKYAYAEYSIEEGKFTDKRYLQSIGVVNSDGELLPDHDIASKKWGAAWRMPTKSQIRELIENTTATKHTQNGVSGLLLTSNNNGNSIFLPNVKTFYAYNAGEYLVPTTGGGLSEYWGASMDEATNSGCMYSYGLSTWGVKIELSLTSYVRDLLAPIRAVSASSSEDKAVDLGLSVKWADRNIGALTAEEPGVFYRWGEVDDYAVYDTTPPIISINGTEFTGVSETNVITIQGGEEGRATDDNHLHSFTANGTPCGEQPYIFESKDATYVMEATDGAGNKTSVVVTVITPDSEAPVIRVNDVIHTNETVQFYNHELPVEVKINDNKRTTFVSVNGVETTERTFNIQPTTDSNARHEYVIIAKDAADNTSTTTVVVITDLTPPVIKADNVDITGQTKTYDKSVQLTATDDVGLASTKVNQTAVTIPYIVPAVDGVYVFEAIDLAGNKSTATVNIGIDSEAPVIKADNVDITGQTRTYDKSVNINITDNKSLSKVTLNGVNSESTFTLSTNGTYVIYAEDANGNNSTATVTIYIDADKPVIKIDDVAKGDGERVYLKDSCVVSATDNVAVTSFTINGVEKPNPSPLSKTANSVVEYTVRAKDDKNNLTTLYVTIDALPPIIYANNNDITGTTVNYNASVVITATDSVSLKTLKVNGTAVSRPYTIPAVNGVYNIEAEDSVGNKSTAVVNIDTDAPKIIANDNDVTNLTVEFATGVNILVTDNRGVESVTINGENTTTSFSISAEDGEYRIVATDTEGNVSEATIIIKLLKPNVLADIPLNINKGNNLVFNNRFVNYILPKIYITSDGGEAEVHLKAYKIRPLVRGTNILPLKNGVENSHSMGFIQSPRIFYMYFRNNNNVQSEEEIREIIERYLLPFNTTNIMQFIHDNN